MSGVEVAGLVLGILPILVEALKAYSSAAEKIHTFRHVSREIGRIQRRFQTQKQLFKNECFHLLSLVVDEDDAAWEMLANKSHALWQDPGLDGKMRKRLCGDNFRTCQDLLSDINEALKDIGDAIKCFDILAASKPDGEKLKDSLRRARKSFNFSTFDKARIEKQLIQLKENLEDLSRITAAVHRFRPQCVSNSKPQKTRSALPEAFSLVQQTSKKLHDVLSREWCCNDLSHAGHDCALLLDARIKDGVRLDMAISIYQNDFPDPSSLHRMASPRWIYVETKPDMNLAIPAPSLQQPKTVLTTINDEVLAPKLKLAADRNSISTPDCETKPKCKKVRFEDDTSNLIPIASSPPSLGSVQLCETLQAPQPSDFCICCLESPEHLLYIGDEDNHTFCKNKPQLHAIPFSDVFHQTQHEIIDPVHKLKAAHRLATAVLQYHSTSWMNEEWRLQDLRYFSTQQNIIDNALRSLHLSGHFPRNPPPTVLMDGIEMASSTNIPNCNNQPISETDRKYLYGISSLPLFSLGVALLEVSHWSRGSPLGPKYREIIKKCLRSDFGFGSDLSKPSLQAAVYNDVVCELEEMIAVLDIGVD